MRRSSTRSAGVPHDPRPVALDAVVRLPGGDRRLTGTVGGVCQNLVVTVSASRVRAKEHLRAWVRAAALTAARPDVEWEVVTVGRHPDSDDVAEATVLHLRMLDHDAAIEALAFLDELRARALCDVIPLVAQTSLEVWRTGGCTSSAFRSAWQNRFGGDGTDRWVAMAIGKEVDDVLDLPRREGEGDGLGPRPRRSAHVVGRAAVEHGRGHHRRRPARRRQPTPTARRRRGGPMSAAPPVPFRIDGPLPTGLTVLEASAGTGKTFSLAGLATRYIAERGIAASELCVVSFTEAATAELRGRIRSGLVDALHHLETGAPSDDPVVMALRADPDQVPLRRDRLALALAEFDSATISTIHGFCSRVVASGGTAGVEVPFTSDDSDVDELVNDRFVERFGATGEWPAKPDRVSQAVRLRLQMPDAEMFRPDPATVKANHLERAERIDVVADLVEEIVAEVLRRRATLRRRTFDSLLVEARELLRGPRGEATRAVLQHRFEVVMIDEFQDTDRVQWDIFRLAFLDGSEAGHGGGRRRPEAVDLPVPFGRAQRLPRRPGAGPTWSPPSTPTGAPTRRCSTRSSDSSGASPSATRRSCSSPWARPTRWAATASSTPAPAPRRSSSVPSSVSSRPRRRSPRCGATASPRSCDCWRTPASSTPMPRAAAGRSRRPTSASSCAPTPMPPRSCRRWPWPGCRPPRPPTTRSSTAWRPPSGASCCRPSSGRRPRPGPGPRRSPGSWAGRRPSSSPSTTTGSTTASVAWSNSCGAGRCAWRRVGWHR